MNSSRDTRPALSTQPGKARAFTLIELLVVIAIIALLIGILLPALAGVRNAAKGAKTKALLASVQEGIASSKLDNNGALPGLFSQADLGSVANGQAGLTAMENILLDLAAGDGLVGRVDLVEANPSEYPSYDPGQVIKVGTSKTDKKKQYYVNPGLFGGGATVLTLDRGDLGNATNDGVGSIGQHGSVGNGAGGSSVANTATTDEANWSMPDLFDAFGNPVMAWVKDDYGPNTVDDTSYNAARDDFVREDSTEPAWFYLNANVGYLATDAFGEKLNRQAWPDDPNEDKKKGSVLGSLTAGAVDFNNETRDAFMALFGNVAYADDPNKSTKADIFPKAALADVIVQSAGLDGVFFRRGDKGYKTNQDTNGDFRFGSSFKAGGDAKSIASTFDDIMTQSR